ncbi:MAG: hypothetical protein UR68_C0013G0033 [Candidatus Roizmanbacteria bacterium GW2011_GWA2_35_19]|uniref:Uncharacterized protein n=2 Tax=Candidatus Roizmaniibacteriota TaxID=1752723 RepID=A0A0G0EBZ8_9BACT|nr:MAG: hypothetical protein UR63_C0020G0035 [Candidatus Roizmanbacteria bacterium GW2011_GWC2_35_12]KKP72720.1 MAG: hypothetical protein UR68_C0013G0033 [Candidatus Roizmanbacteria bacterium GW2011_GWA2_35_19]
MKESLGIITIILSVIGHTPYIVDTIRGKTKPHLFTWLTWSIIVTLAFFGQWISGGGAGSWGTGVTGAIVIIIAILAFRKGTKDVTRLDKVFFIGSIISIIPWYITKNPIFSIILVTLIDALAFVPTIRKTINNPASETLFTYLLNILRHGLSLFALGRFNFTTALYPIYLLVMNLLMTIIIYYPKIKKGYKNKS